jgi:hypothetical protein
MEVSRGDSAVDKGADSLERFAQKAAESGGVQAKAAPALAEDAAFLRQLKPSLIAARARGETPTDGQRTAVELPAPKPGAAKKDGPNPLLVVGGAFALGVVVARVIDWIGYAQPRN